MNSQYLKKNKLPDSSGVYFFKSGSKILYIGKATSLRDRVRSYFSKDLIETRGPMILDMVNKATSIKYEKTDSVLEALILEANLIKKYQPFYNIKEKDDKSFNYVCITKEDWPKVITIRGKDLKEKQEFSAVYGPYTSGGSLREALKIIRRIIPYLDEKSKVKGTYEFYKQIGLAPDSSKREEYIKNIRNIKLFFAGKKKKILEALTKDMKKLAKNRRFEEAANVRNRIFALKHINDIALVKGDREYVGDKDYRIEAYDVAHTSGKEMVGVMVVFEGEDVRKDEYRKFKIKSVSGPNDTAALLEILERRFSNIDWPMPKLIVLDGGKAQLNTAKNFQERVGLKIPMAAVVKDDKHKPKGIIYLGVPTDTRARLERSIIASNSEAHRFAINYHRNLLRKRI